MQAIIDHFHSLIRANQLPQLEQTCLNLLWLNRKLKALGLAEFEQSSALVPAPTIALTEEMAVAVCRLLYPDPKEKIVYLCQLFAIQHFRAGEALIQDGVVLTAEARKSSHYMNLSPETRAVLEAQCALFEMQKKLLKPEFDAFQHDLDKVMAMDVKTIAEYLQNIIENKIANPYGLKQWQKFVAVINEKYKQTLAKHLNLERFDQYRHPDAEASSSNELSKQQKESIEANTKAMLGTQQQKLPRDDVAKLVQYFQLLSRRETVPVQLISDIELILEIHQIDFSYYYSNLDKLCPTMQSNQMELVKSYFAEQIVQQLKKDELPARYQKRVVPSLTSFNVQKESSFLSWFSTPKVDVNKKEVQEQIIDLFLQVKNSDELLSEVKAIFWLTFMNAKIISVFKEKHIHEFTAFVLQLCQNKYFTKHIEFLDFDFLTECLSCLKDTWVEPILFLTENKFNKQKVVDYLVEQKKWSLLENHVDALKEFINPYHFVAFAESKEDKLFEKFWRATDLTELINQELKAHVRDASILRRATLNYYARFLQELIKVNGSAAIYDLVLDSPLYSWDLEYEGDGETGNRLKYLCETYFSSRSYHIDDDITTSVCAAKYGNIEMLKALKRLRESYFDQAKIYLLKAAVYGNQKKCIDYLFSVGSTVNSSVLSQAIQVSKLYPDLLSYIMKSAHVEPNEEKLIDLVIYPYHEMSEHWLPFLLQHNKLTPTMRDYIFKNSILMGYTLPVQLLLQAKSYSANTKLEGLEIPAIMVALSQSRIRFTATMIPLFLNCSDLDLTMVDKEGLSLIDRCLDENINHQSTVPASYHVDSIPYISVLIELDREFKIPNLEKSLQLLRKLEAWASKESGPFGAGLYLARTSTDIKNNEIQSSSVQEHQNKLLIKIRESLEKLCDHWLKKMLQNDVDAAHLVCRDPTLFMKNLIKLTGTLSDTLKKRAEATVALIEAIKLISGHGFFASESRIKQHIENSLLINPAILVSFANGVLAQTHNNPLSIEQWQLFRSYLQTMIEGNKRWIENKELLQLHEYFYPASVVRTVSFASTQSGATSSSSSSEMTLVPAAIAKIQACANEVIETLNDENISDAERKMLLTLFEPIPKELAAYHTQREQRIAARNWLKDKNQKLVLQYLAAKDQLAPGDIKPEQQEQASALFTSKVCAGLKIASMNTVPSQAALLGQSNPLLSNMPNVPEGDLEHSKEKGRVAAPAM